MTESTGEAPISIPSWRDAIRGNVLMMGLVSLFTDFSSEMMNPLLPVFIAGLVPLGSAAMYLGLMEGLAETTASLLKIFSGRLSDALGKRKALVILGYGLSTLARPLMALAGAGMHVVGLKFVDRVGKGVRTSPRDALIGDSVPKEFRGLAFSFHRSMDNAGAVLGPVVAVGILYLLVGHVLWTSPAAPSDRLPSAGVITSLRWLFGLALLPGLAAMASLVLKVREVTIVKRTAGPGGVWRQLPRRFYAFAGIVTLFALGNSSDLFILFLAVNKFGMTLLEIIGLWVFFHVSKIVFGIPGGILSDKFGRRPVILTGWIVYALVYLGLAVASQLWHFWALILVYGVYYGMAEGTEKALVADFVPSEFRGSAFGIYNAAIGIAALPANLVFGVLYGISPLMAFGLGALLAGAAAVLLIVLLSTSKPAPQAA